MLTDIMLIIGGLAGLGGFISILVNLLKQLNVVKDGTADQWFQGINLVVFVAVTIVYMLNVPVDWGRIDGWLAILSTVMGLVIQTLGGKLPYTALKGAPVIGFSYSKEIDKTNQ